MNLEKTRDAVQAEATGNCATSGVYRCDLENQDPQNLAACTRRCGFMMIRALIALQPPGPKCMRGPNPTQMNRACLPAVNGDPTTVPVLDAVLKGTHNDPWVGDAMANIPQLQTQGTVAYYCLAAAHTLIHNSKFWGIGQRIRFAGFTNRFLAGWRQWVLHTPGITTKEAFLTPETYTDVVQNIHEAVLTILAFREFCPSQPCALHHSGSNCCENKFSFSGGYSYITGVREYTAKKFIRMDDRSQVLNLLQIQGVKRGRSQHIKQEWPARFHEIPKNDVEFRHMMSQYLDDAQSLRAWEAGTSDAVTLLNFLGCFVGVPARIRQNPWIGEKLHVAVDERTRARALLGAPPDDSNNDSGGDNDDDDSRPDE